MAGTGERRRSDRWDVDEDRRIRPWLWLVGGLLFAVTGIVCCLLSVAALREPDDISGLPACPSAGHAATAADCVVERAATVQRHSYSRRAWLAGEQAWLVSVPEGVPGRPASTPQTGDRIVVPRQRGAGEVHAGLDLRLVYYHRRAALVRLPSGVDLETDDHPNRYAPTMGYAGLFGLGLSVFPLGRGWRSGRRGGWWRRTPMVEAPFWLMAPLFLGGGAAFVTQLVAGSHRLPALVALAAGVALSVWVVLKQSGRLAR